MYFGVISVQFGPDRPEFSGKFTNRVGSLDVRAPAAPSRRIGAKSRHVIEIMLYRAPFDERVRIRRF